MSCGYACVGCGRCRGNPRELQISSVCFRCGFENEEGARACAKCGLELPRKLPERRVEDDVEYGSVEDTKL